MAPGSGEIYNLITKPPKTEGVCDVSGETLVHRPDDKVDVVNHRFSLFLDNKDAILNYFGTDKVFEVNADCNPEFVFDEIVKNCIK